MRVLVIDGQGGGLGRQLVTAITALCPEVELTAVGVNARRADIIVGPIGIVIADALLGEITPAMAAAICQADAKRVLIPVNHCENFVVGVPEGPVSQLVQTAAQKVKALCTTGCK